MSTKGVVLALALMLAGCADMQLLGLPGLQGDHPEQQQVVELIGYAQKVAAMSADQQHRAYAKDNQAFAKDKSAYSRVRLALLLATPGASVRDDARAADLLEPLAAQGEHAGPIRLLASIMHAQIAERQREQKRHEQIRQQIEAERQRIEADRQQIETERQREHKQVEQLRQQIEALKSVERSITERVQPAQPRRQ
ncbi:MAG: hypothetical protein HY661_00125 [Betaproteobacteria bacterium]|nr:hypothetical protein [Betaproteobacteria bacterium]